jgi:hypothetical protein
VLDSCMLPRTKNAMTHLILVRIDHEQPLSAPAI